MCCIQLFHICLPVSFFVNLQILFYILCLYRSFGQYFQPFSVVFLRTCGKNKRFKKLARYPFMTEGIHFQCLFIQFLLK